MLKITERITVDQDNRGNIIAEQILSLPYEMRKKSRFLALLDNGEEVGLIMSRGKTLRDGDLVKDESGRIIKVCAAEEPVTTISADEATLFARLCYHLGNRHVPLQIDIGWARYLQDHVLDEMVLTLGGQLKHESVAFEPESGAYHAHHHES